MEDITQAQIEVLAEQLRELQTELEQVLQRTTQASRIVATEDPNDSISRREAVGKQKMAAVDRQAAKTRLAQVQLALRAIDTDDGYGECGLCGEPIGFKRLKAKPETPYCLDCQTKRSRRV